MQFKVFFTATGSTLIEADSQADAEEKSENLSDEQVAEGIDSVEIMDVAKASEPDDRTMATMPTIRTIRTIRTKEIRSVPVSR